MGALVEAKLLWNTEQPRLLVRTRENVLASLCPRTGQLLWRQVLELSPRGDIKLMHYLPLERLRETKFMEHNEGNQQSYDVLTIQGHAPALVRGWYLKNNGHIESEWSLMPLQPDLAEKAFWIYSQPDTLYHVVPVWKSHLEITQYRASTGQVKGNTAKLTSPWIQENRCVVTGVYLVCLDDGEEGQQRTQLLTIDVTANSPRIHTKLLDHSASSQGLQIVQVLFVCTVTQISLRLQYFSLCICV